VIVNTVVYVRTVLGRPENDVAIALAAFGGGSMLAALSLPRLLERRSDRQVMLTAAVLLLAGLLAVTAFTVAPGVNRWWALLAMWAVLGVGYSAVQTPSGRLLRRSAAPEDRSALFAAQFALSHACWLVTYGVAGNLGAAMGMPAALLALAGLTLLGLLIAVRVWPKEDPDVVGHDHPELAADHPHVRQHASAKARHAHDFVIDELHRQWPKKGL